MGPNEEPHNFSSNSPIRVDSIESDDEEIARLRAEGWQIGFGVQMHVAVAAEDDGQVNAGDQNSESDATNDAQFSDADNGENPPTPNCGYVLLPSAVEEEPCSPSATAPTTAFNWLPTNSTPNSCILPPPPTAAELGRIQHKPIDIKLDNVKVEEIKRIMSQMALLGPQPEWVQTIDDEKLSELVGQLKKAEVTGGK